MDLLSTFSLRSVAGTIVLQGSGGHLFLFLRHSVIFYILFVLFVRSFKLLSLDLVLDLICEYCEIYLNCVLFKTKIYTKSYFDKVQKYNIIVYVRFRFTFIFKIKKFFLLRNVKMK